MLEALGFQLSLEVLWPRVTYCGLIQAELPASSFHHCLYPYLCPLQTHAAHIRHSFTFPECTLAFRAAASAVASSTLQTHRLRPTGEMSLYTLV